MKKPKRRYPIVHPTVEDVGKPKWLSVSDWNVLKAYAAMCDQSCSEVMRDAVEDVLTQFLLENAKDPEVMKAASGKRAHS